MPDTVQCPSCDTRLVSGVKFCPDCGAQLGAGPPVPQQRAAPAPPALPRRPAPTQQPQKASTTKRDLLIVVCAIPALFLVIGLFMAIGKTTRTSTAAPAREPEADPFLAAMPADEIAFCKGLVDSAAGYRQAESASANQLQLSQIKAARRAVLEQAIKQTNVTSWVGTISHLSTTSAGEAGVAISLPCGGVVKTWTNSLSDIGSNTLIPQSSPLYSAFAERKVGSRVRFSGVFVWSKNQGFREASLTERGSMMEPEFIFRFTDLGQY